MARGASITVENSFNRGLITEFTAMNFPEQAVTDTDNCVFTEFGEVTRRLGIDYEPNATTHVYLSEGAVTEYEWFSVNNNGAVKMVVQQTGGALSFFAVSSSGSLSENKKSFTIDMTVYRTTGTSQAAVAETECRYTTGRGYLFVTHPLCQPIYVEYDPATDSISVNTITVEIRDLKGVDDGLAIDTNPTSLSGPHHYNLLNQGWYFLFEGTSVLSLWQTNPRSSGGGRSDYPSNADIWWLNKRTAFGDDPAEDGAEIFDSRMAQRYTLGNTPAPKGYYIYDAFNINRTSRTGISGLSSESAGSARPSVCAFYAGRVWYAGTKAPGYSSRIYFSQLIERDDQFGKCYQINDPTSETTFDLIDTDGGVMELPLMEEVTAMTIIRDSLLIMGTNGIYVIRGSDTGPFRATNYVVEFISNVGVENHKSVVEVDTGLLWWGTDSIYAMTPDQVGLSFQVQNISKQTIQSLIDQVPFSKRAFIKGAFSKREQIVRWIYSDLQELDDYEYNRVLEMNINGPAFYPHTLDLTAGPRVKGIIVVSGQGLSTFNEDITTIALENVTTVSLEVVQTEEDVFVPNPEVFKFFTRNGVDMTYSEIWRSTHTDWQTTFAGGVSFSSRCTSGFRIRGELLRNFNSTPIVFVVRNSDESPSLLVSGIWDYGSHQSMKQELYYKVVPQAQDYIVRRVKIRGKGKSLQLDFESVGDSPFNLLGWSTFDHGGTAP